MQLSRALIFKGTTFWYLCVVILILVGMCGTLLIVTNLSISKLKKHFQPSISSYFFCAEQVFFIDWNHRVLFVEIRDTRLTFRQNVLLLVLFLISFLNCPWTWVLQGLKRVFMGCTVLMSLYFLARGGTWRCEHIFLNVEIVKRHIYIFIHSFIQQAVGTWEISCFL